MSTQFNEYLVSTGAYRPRRRRAGEPTGWQRRVRRRWLLPNLVRTRG